MDSNKQKHLELIQQVISRMGGNLFYLRGWSITLAAGLLALLSRQDNPDTSPLIILAIVLVLFWIYDGYFLSMERKYRDLYNKVRILPDSKIDFSMSIKEFNKFKTNSLLFCVFSKTIAPFYMFLLGVVIYLVNKGG
ncbi:MAG TPA: hypothetical protein VFW77_02555 [Candidatus Saccharimonadales bacterium]|nr:hypothetical protein [Candidatus Saccharimonadales bacterium]